MARKNRPMPDQGLGPPVRPFSETFSVATVLKETWFPHLLTEKEKQQIGRDRTAAAERRAAEAAASEHVHDWSEWKEIGRTGDWFHPLIVERKCKTCGAQETDEH